MKADGTATHRSVLIVEDDQLTREALSKILSMLGYETCPVGTIAEGVEKLDGQDCAIVDLNLPDGLGTYILRRITSEKRTMRVAVVTAATDEALVTRAQAYGAEIILRKPLELSELLRWLEDAPGKTA